ncbi:MAG: DMT family transporter [Anaerolineaceae bacterium]|nr:MAG: DMT family transporter [Anaerolineaceae bacterium]
MSQRPESSPGTERRVPLDRALLVLSTPVLLGLSPILGKFAINANADPFAVAAIRTTFAVVMMWMVYLIFFRKYIYIYPAGLLGCVVVGAVNGIGSLFYYAGLGLLDASLVQLINGLYLAFAVLISRFGGQVVDRRTLVRVGLALVALVMLTGFGDGGVNGLGVGLMIGSALMFAGTVVLSQYVLYEMPSPTATLYILTTMAVLVTMVWLSVGEPIPQDAMSAALPPILALGLSTALSRLAMFAGVKFMGGMQTAVLAIAEIGVALLLAALFLGDTLTTVQWVGVAVLFTGMLLIRQQDLSPRGYNPNALIVANMASVQFQRIAFHRAFGTREDDNEAGTMASVTTQEMVAIQRMMGAESGGIDPYPIRKINQINQAWAEPPPLPDDEDAGDDGDEPDASR